MEVSQVDTRQGKGVGMESYGNGLEGQAAAIE